MVALTPSSSVDGVLLADMKKLLQAEGSSTPKASGSPAKTKSTKTTKPKNNDTRPLKRKREVVPEQKAPSQKSNGASKSSDKDSSSNPFLQEILSLGGSKEDFDLLVGVDSDSEIEGGDGQKLDEKKLKEDTRSVLKSLNFASVASEDAGTSDEESSSEEASEEDSDGAEELPPAPVPKTKKSASAAKVSKAEFICTPRSDWIEIAPPPKLPKHPKPVSAQVLAKVKAYAKEILEQENTAYASSRLSASSHKFLSTVMVSGTLSDKISALTLVVQESPLHNVKSLESLLGLSKKKSRSAAINSLGAVKDLFSQGSLLPSDRKLRTFAQQPGLALFSADWDTSKALPSTLTKAHLAMWAYEDWLKTLYFDLLQVLEYWCSDQVEYAQARALGYVGELLSEKPEQEANLLRIVLNKLGDPEKKIASKASFLLRQLQTTHPLMKSIIITSIAQEMLRSEQNPHMQYYSLITLNQTILSDKEPEVADQLLKVYFQVFQILIKAKAVADAEVNNPVKHRKNDRKKPPPKKVEVTPKDPKVLNEEMKEKLISAILTGVNRAFPFSQMDDISLEGNLEALFKIAHSVNINTRIQALQLIWQVTDKRQVTSDRYYRSLYDSLLDLRLASSSKQTMYLNLLYRSLRGDPNKNRVAAFVKRLIQTTGLHQPSFVCGVLFLVNELTKLFPSLVQLLTEPEETVEEREEGTNGGVSINGKSQSGYSGFKREPEFSGAEKSCLWELDPLGKHYHPSVALFAAAVGDKNSKVPKPELSQHTLISFLDKFVYKNPKKKDAALRGSSLMQPMTGATGKGNLLVPQSRTKLAQPVNSESFWKRKVESIPADQIFFHKYFNQLSRPASTKKAKEAEEDSEDVDDDEDGEEDDDEIWQAVVNSQPDLEADEDDSDIDMDMEGFDTEEEDAAEEEVSDPEGLAEELENGDNSDDKDAGKAEGEAEDFDDDILGGSSELDSDEELEAAAPLPAAKEESKKSGQPATKKRRLKDLPTFASADDYAHLLGNDDDEDY